MGNNLEGRVAIVTGSARGIGKAICEKLASEGAKVVVVDISPEAVEATAAEFRANGIDAFGVAANVAKMEDCEAAVKAVMEKYGRVDILVNNAGITRDTLMLRMGDAEWDSVMAVNLKGVFNFTKACIRPMMKAKFGKIVNMASVVGKMGNVGQANYSASKAGV
ncbi:MAG: SDR family NAD(P)-dependent oxidoreductase, partial [Lentisphaeria bacterium]|nr:SDR family NAD(P)-dependent oxidoreductase [Lentisphaeria bacterium]